MLVAYHNEPALKVAVLARVDRHRAQDEIMKGRYWVRFGGKFRGCAVGCTLHSDQHADYESQLGIPVALAHLQDRIFESLPDGEHLDFPGRFLRSIPVGADLSLVWPRFARWLILDPEHGVCRHTDDESVAHVGHLYERVIAGGEVTTEEWETAAAYAAAATHAYAANVVAQRDELLRLLSTAPLAIGEPEPCDETCREFRASLRAEGLLV